MGGWPVRHSTSAMMAVLFYVSNFACTATAAPADANKPPTALDPKVVCNRVNKQLDVMTATRELLLAAGSKVPPDDKIKEILKGDLSLDNPNSYGGDPEFLAVAAILSSVLSNRWKSNFINERPEETRKQYFTELSDRKPRPVITCVAFPSSPTRASQDQGWRLRGTPDDLDIWAQNASAFAGASKATFSLSGNQATKVTAGIVAGALGYYIPLDSLSNIGIVPYVAGNYNLSKTEGKPAKFSSDTIDFGSRLLWSGQLVRGSYFTLSIAPDYLHNYVDGSSVISLHPAYTPIIKGKLNDPRAVNWFDWLPAKIFGSSGTTTYETLSIDIRSDIGAYEDRGIQPFAKTNTDYVLVGSKFGMDIAKKNWYEFSVYDVQMYGPEGARRHVSDFESSFTYYFGAQNVLGLTASYKTGIVEESLQKEQIWALGVTAKY